MRRIARILLDDPTSLFRLPEGYPNFIPGDPSFYCPYEANPIYTSLTVTATYSGSRTNTIDNIVSKAITTIVYSGSVSWTWNRVYPSNYNNYDYNLFLTDPTMPARADEAYFGLGVSHDLSDDMNHLFGLINPKRQTLILQRGSYEGSPPLVVVGTQTYTVEIPGIVRLKMADRAARTGRNPQTGEPLAIPARRVVKATVVKTLA